MPDTVLLVDDDPIVHWVLNQYLGRAGFRTLSAKNGRDALDAAVRELPQLIILDVRMSEMDGMAALRQLKAGESTKSIPVIIMTASVDHRTKLESELFGAAVFVTKPFSPVQLLADVKRLIAEAQGAHEPSS